MKAEKFETILMDRLAAIEKVLGSKAKEYAQDNDRLYNFKVAARVNNQSVAQAAWGMATKHLVSVMDLVEGKLEATPEMVDEKCLDLINYIILISAILLEKEGEE